MKRGPLRVLVLLGLVITASHGTAIADTGACCADGLCLPDLTDTECSDLGGVNQGTGSTCPADGFCAGACCAAQVCTADQSKTDCEAGGGVFQGGQSVCAAEDNAADELCTVGFTGHTVSTNTLGATSVSAADLDGDGDGDLLSASAEDDKIAWHENDGGTPPSFTEHVIATSADGARSVVAADLDGDGDLDVLSASQNDDKIAWYESDGASPPVFGEHIITGDRVLSATSLALAIPDDGYPGSGVSHTLSVSESFVIQDVDLGLQITHSWVGDLVIQIEHLGTTVTVINQPGDASDTAGDPFGCDQDNYHVTLDDEAGGGAIEDQCSASVSSPPSYTPNGALTAFDDLDAAGDWTISVFDSAVAETGTLDGWTLRISGAPAEGFAEGVASVTAADVDGDGDLDVLSAAPFADTHCSDDFSTRCVSDEDCVAGVCAQTLAWYENDGGSPPTFTAQLIPGNSFGPDATFVVTADLDDDADMDVIATSGGLPGEGVCSSDPAQSCVGADDCGPGVCESVTECDLDSPDPGLSCTSDAECTPGTCVTVNECAGTDMPCVTDTDCPSDACILTRSIAWYENNGASTPGFTEHLIEHDIGAAWFSLAVADLDRDGDLDIVSAASGDATLGWYENDGAFPPAFIPHVVSRDVLSVFAVSVDDIDGDGDPDIAATSAGNRCGGETMSPGELCTLASDCSGSNSTCIAESRVGWYENLGGVPPLFSPRTRRVSNALSDVQALIVADVDRDGDLDLASASAGDDKVAWYESGRGLDVVNLNTGRQFGTIAAAVANAASGHMLSAAPTRFDTAEPVIDFRGKALTLQSRGAITQPPGGLYTLANHSLLRTAAGNWNVTLSGELFVPSGAQAEVWASGFSTTGIDSALSLGPNTTLGVASAASLEGATSVENNATLTFDGDLAFDGTLSLGLGSTVTAEGAVTAMANSVMTSSGEVRAGSDISIMGQADLGPSSAVQSDAALTISSGSQVTGFATELIAATSLSVAATVDLDGGSIVRAGGDIATTVDADVSLATNSAILGNGNVDLAGQVTLSTGSFLTAGAALAVLLDGQLAGSDAVITATGAFGLEGPVSLTLGSTVNVGGDLSIVDNAAASLSLTASDLFVEGDATLDGPVNLGVGSTIDVTGALNVPDDAAMTTLTLGEQAALRAGGDATLQRPVSLDTGASLVSGGALSVSSTGMLDVGPDAVVSAGGDMTLAAPTALAVNSLLASDAGIENTSDATFFGAGIAAGTTFTNRMTLTGFGTIQGDFFNDTLATALYRADTEVVGDYTNGTEFGQCDDTIASVAGNACSTNADCGSGTCTSVMECSATADNPGDPCTLDSECPSGTCETTDECDAASEELAGTACSVDNDCRGICINAVTAVEDNSVLVILGTLINFGEMNGTVQPPPLTASANVVRATAPYGLTVRDDFVATRFASFLLPTASLLKIGADFDAAIDDSTRFDLSRAQLWHVGDKTADRSMEVMSRDVGPSPLGLDRRRPGHFPIDSLRITSAAGTVHLVDRRDNDGLGQETTEAVYVKSLIVEPGAVLMTSGHRIYYASLTLDGNVDNAAFLVPLEALFADLDRDFDVDLADHALLLECLSGPAVDVSLSACGAGGSQAADINADGHVDLGDIQAAQIAFTGR